MEEKSSGKTILKIITIICTVGLVFMLLGAISFGIIGIVLKSNLNNFCDEALAVEGYIVEADGVESSTTIGFYDEEYGYCEVYKNSYSSSVQTGDTVTVYYDSEDPYSIKVKELDGIVGNVFVILGIVFTAIVVFFGAIFVIIRLVVGAIMKKKM